MKKNTSLLGTKFEDRIFALLPKLFDAGIIPFSKQNAEFHRFKEFYSVDRDGPIKFENVVEIYSTENREDNKRQPSLVLVFECKDYPERSVEVGEVEEFRDKLHQIRDGRPKGYMLTTGRFARGGINIARGSGIGLVRIFPEDDVKITSHFIEGFGEDGIRALTELNYLPTSHEVGLMGEELFYSFSDMLKSDLSVVAL